MSTPSPIDLRLSRLFVSCELKSGIRIHLDPDTAHYARSVLRLKAGDPMVVFNGQGGEYAATIIACNRKETVLEIGTWSPRDLESKLVIELGLGISRGERMDFSIQKAVELGVYAITPLFTIRSVVRLPGEKSRQRRDHWQKVAQSASEQSGRDRQVPVAPPISLAAWKDQAAGLKLLLDPRADRTLNDIAHPAGPVSLGIGPEGGFDDRERDQLIAAGFIAIRLGPRILRAETAVLAAISALQTRWGDFCQ